MQSLHCQLALIAVLGIALSEAGVGNIEMKPLSATKPRRYMLGSLIKSDEGDGMLLEHSGNKSLEYQLSDKEKGTMLGKDLSIGINPMHYRRTMVTLPLPDDLKSSSDHSKLIKNYYCENIRFLAIEDLSNMEKIPENTLVIISNDLKASILNKDVCKTLREKNTKLGFLRRFLPLEEQCRQTLVECKVGFIENLDLPNDFDLMSAVKSTDKRYYGFKMMFAPFKNATTLYSDEKVQQRALVNLADMVMFEGDDRLNQFCSNKRDDIVDFSHKLVSDKFPVMPDVELPHFIMRGGEGSKNESEQEYWLRFSGRSGTHLVAPYRYDKSRSNIGNLDDSFFFSPCTCISSPYGDVPNFRVTKGHLEQWEKDKGRKIPENSAIFINTGFGVRWLSQPEKYVKDYPGIDVEALKWLVEERKVVAIGIDSLAIDDYSLSKDNKWPGHGYLASKNIPVVLNMNFVDNGADKFPDEGSRCVFSYLRIDRGTSSPCAVFGLPGYDKMELGGKGGGSGSGMNLGGGRGGEMKKPDVGKSGSNLSGGLSSSKRWQFGHLIRNQADTCGDCSIRVVDMSLFGAETSGQKMMRFSEIGLTVDPSVNKLTTFTQPSEMPYLSMKGCVETLFIKTTEINSIKKKLQDVVKDETAVIFLTTDLFKLHDESLMKEAAAKHVCLGFFDDIQLPGDVRNILLRYNLTFFENLVRPEGFNDESIDENKLYYSFKFIFAPFAEGTSYGESLKSMDPPRKVNLADIVVYDSNEREVVDRCVKKNLIMLSHEWSPVDKVPITPNMSRPTLVDNGNKMMFFDHFGTHIDSPAHMDESNKMDIAHLPDTLDRPVCLRIDIPYRGQPSFTITKQHFVDWESASGVKIPSKSLVFLSTGFGAKNWDNVGDYQENFPGLSIDGARFLVEERGVVGIGIDSLTIDVYSVVKSSTFPVHEYLSSKNVIIIENIGGNDLSKMTYDGTAQCVLSYLRLEGATGSPVAVYGLLSDSPKEVKPIEPKPGQGGETITTETTTKKSAASSSAMPGHLLIGLTVISYPFLARF